MTDLPQPVPNVSDALGAALLAHPFDVVDGALVAVATLTAARLDQAVAEDASPAAVSQLVKEMRTTLVTLGLVPRKVGGQGDPVGDLIASFGDPA